MRWIAPFLGLALLGCGVGCQTTPSFVLEPQAPYELGEPAYLLRPTAMTLGESLSVLVPRLPSATGAEPAQPVLRVMPIGPENTTPPRLAPSSAAALRQIAAELPAHLPKRAAFLVKSDGSIVEVAFLRARDALNERVFAARLRAQRFSPATHLGKPVAVICDMDLTTGRIGTVPSGS